MPPSIQPRNGATRPQQPPARPSTRPEPVDRTSVMPPVPPTATPPRAPSRQAPPRQAPPTNQPPRTAATPPAGPGRKRHRVRTFFIVLAVVLIGAVLWFWFWVQSNLNTVDALSGAAGTPGQTYLIVGSDSRDGWGEDGTEGARTDTIMVLHKPDSGPTALISIPRDSYVEIPGHDANKINAAFAFGGPQLLVETVENLTGLTVDHYLEIGFTGVSEIVDALGGVELCYDSDVSDQKSRLEWEAGCHVADGDTALAFSRMRYSDPLGDIGRTQRQRQLVGAVAKEALSPATVLNPFALVPMVGAGLDAFRVSEGTGPFDLARFALTFRSGLADDAVTGTPPIKDMGYRVDGVGSTVLLDPEWVDKFWTKIANGEYEPGSEVGGVG